mgnify:CR=1 FL=1
MMEGVAMFGIGKNERKKNLETIEDVLQIGIRVKQLKEDLDSVIDRQKEIEMLFNRFNETLRSTQDKKLAAENERNQQINEMYLELNKLREAEAARNKKKR